VAAALCALDLLKGSQRDGVRVLLTRAEEVGLIGAIGACSSGVIARNARIVALECSKSFADSPIGGGPIVRVGDRTSTFDPELTYQVGRVAAGIAAGDGGFKWQRCLMPGGTCEATAYQAFGYAATCLCLPLGNYHNMNESKGKIDSEWVSVSDFEGLVRLLVAIARDWGGVSAGSGLRVRLAGLLKSRRGLVCGGAVK
jgi:endoglucanase